MSFSVNGRLGGVSKLFEDTRVAFHQLGDGLARANGGFNGEFLSQKERGAGVDDRMVWPGEHFVQGKIGEGGGFTGLAFPEERPEAGAGIDKFVEDGLLVEPEGLIGILVHILDIFLFGNPLTGLDGA